MKIDGGRWIWEGCKEIRGEEESGDEKEGKSEALQRVRHHHARQNGTGGHRSSINVSLFGYSLENQRSRECTLKR